MEYAGKRFELAETVPSQVIEHMVARNCIFDNCRISLVRALSDRVQVRNVELIDCTAINCQFGPLILSDVSVINLRTNDLLILWAPEFHHVKIVGKCGKIKINREADILHWDESLQSQFDMSRHDLYSSIDWALDISEAELTEFEATGVPANLVRRNPNLHFIVTRDRVLETGWREKFQPSTDYWQFALDQFLESNEKDTIFVAPRLKSKKRFKELHSELLWLRELGVALPN